MFWKFDEEEEKVVPKEEPKKLTPTEFAEKAREAGHDSFPEETDDFLSSDETGAGKRFDARVQVFEKENKPVYKHHFWWFVHNCIAHPAIGILPNKSTFDFHDWTSKKINGK